VAALNYFKYGTYQHEDWEVEVTIEKSANFTSRQIPISHNLRMNLNGILIATTQAELTTKILALEAAYSQPASSCGLYLNGKLTAIKIENTKGGVQVASGPNYPQGNGGEYSTYRHYQIGLEATVDVPEGQTDPVLQFSESLSFSGTCGPKFVYQPTLTGPPVKQIVAQQTTMKVVQSGNAVGYNSRPLVPRALFPNDEHFEERKIDIGSPRRIGIKETYIEYPVSWQYVFESNSPLSGNPNRWTIA
jgi:hypothetical protein